MSNQVLGITGVFAVTFFALGLRHLLLIWGQPSRRRHVSPPLPSTARSNTAEDDSWLLRPQDYEREPGSLAGSENKARTTKDFGRAPRSSIHSVK
jgi:hypothetical protein